MFTSITKKAAMNTCVQGFGIMLFYFMKMPRSQVARSYGRYMCCVLRNCQAIFIIANEILSQKYMETKYKVVRSKLRFIRKYR